MSRELKRVPLDFEWPMNKPWEGYINPHYKKCDACDGNGSTLGARSPCSYTNKAAIRSCIRTQRADSLAGFYEAKRPITGIMLHCKKKENP